MRRAFRRITERVTLVIDPESIRLLSTRGTGVVRWGSAPLPRGILSSEGIVADPEGMAQRLVALWESHSQPVPLPRRNLRVAGPGHRIVSKMVLLDRNVQPDPDQLETLAAEALPSPELYRDWQQVGPATRPELFVIAARHQWVESYLAAFALAELQISHLDAKPLALIRGIGVRHALILDGERSLGTIIIVDEALPRRVRFQLLDSPLLLPAEEKITRLTVTMHQVLRSYHQGDAETSLHPAVPVYLTGTLAHEPLLGNALQHALGLRVAPLMPPFELPADLPVAHYVANFGLALKES